MNWLKRLLHHSLHNLHLFSHLRCNLPDAKVALLYIHFYLQNNIFVSCISVPDVYAVKRSEKRYPCYIYNKIWGFQMRHRALQQVLVYNYQFFEVENMNANGTDEYLW